MDEHTFSVLEFNKIKRWLKEIAVSPVGEEKIEEMVPLTNWEEVFTAQRKTTEMREIIRFEGSPPWSRLEDIATELKKSEIEGAILEAPNFLKILKVLTTLRLVKKFLGKTKEKYPLIKERAEKINTFLELEQEITNCIGEGGLVLDRASVNLKKIRKEMSDKEQALKRKLESIIRSAQFAPLIQEPLITLRQDRYVIPVKQGQKGKLPGIVHDKSDSGATLFIEPLEVVELNNALRELIREEEREILKILQRLTTLIGEKAADISSSLLSLGEIDFIYARAVLANKMEAIEPELNKEGFISLIQARHPLLKETGGEGRIVPIDLSLGKDFNILVITGPNTGGKTVTLKTVGLLSLMAQSGLHLPVAKGSEVTIFQKIFADIGDEQSIEQNLSTFSAHMKYIIQILKEADSQSLVLLDELGAGTDPTEGAALGIAILDYLKQKGAKVIATTHHDSLKSYAYLTEGVSNARVEFDEKTLKPTFQVSIGLPGKSCAFRIAERLGLPRDIVSRAQSLLTKEKMEASNLIGQLEQDKKILEKEKELIKITREEAVEIKKELAKELSEIREKKGEIFRQTYKEAEEIFKKAQNKVEKMVEDWGKKKLNSTKSKGPLLKEIREIKEEVKDKLLGEGEQVKSLEVKIGDYVRIKNLNREGILLSISDRSEEGKVQIEGMKIIVPLWEIEKIEEEGKLGGALISEPKRGDKSKKTVAPNNLYLSKIKTFKNELSLRQFRVEEAKLVLEKYLDDAYLLGISPVYIIHGKGKGILREEVRKLLSNLPYVQSFKAGDAAEGGTGVTVVYLKIDSNSL